MIDIKKAQGIIFDYGATIDSNGIHWAEVLWEAYETLKVPVTKQQFRDAYVYGERYLALNPVIKPTDNFRQVLEAKTNLQIDWLIKEGFLDKNEKSLIYPFDISNHCYNFVNVVLKKAKPILKKLSEKYPLVLVSNFYGNVEAVLNDFDLRSYFKDIIESAVVGVRKPDPAIFSLGVQALGLKAEEVVVIGDSHRKDIEPARTIGCQTIWLKGPGWGDEDENATADCIIEDFSELKDIFFLIN
ncbi:HAD family hydrolase [Bacteroidales bacterium OttesenSCG-928-M11]|nr:HAD family hydrolase [Bacteroidales bacterium OttesenSCG-928-M11]